MPWSPSAADLRWNEGFGLIGAYKRDGGLLGFEGPRPGPGWHRHDMRPRTFLVVSFVADPAASLPRVRLVRTVVMRRRWRLGGTTQTRQDRCPDEVGSLQVVLLVLLLKLWAWLDAGCGLLRREEVAPALAMHGCDRTVQRWLARVRPHALTFQRAVVAALIERCEPRPVEQLFPGGLPPPDALVRRRWSDPAGTSTLWQGLAWLFAGARELDVSITALLAEVHGRTPDLTFTS